MHSPENNYRRRWPATAAVGVLCLVLAGCRGSVASPAGGQPAAGSNPPAPLTAKPLRGKAVEIIRHALQGPQTAECLYAAEIAADVGAREFAPDLQKLLKAENVPVRFAAAMALGDLKHLPARVAIQESLNDPDQNVQMAAIYAMNRFGSGKDLIKRVYEGLSSRDQTIRANAALILGKLRDPAALTALRWAMTDKDSGQDVRTQAAYSLALIGDDKIYPTLWTLLISSFANYRIQGIEAMGALNDAQARNAVYTMLEDDTLDVRLAAAEQLGAMRDQSGAAVVLEFLKSPPASTDQLEAERRKVRAARAVGSIGTADLAAFLPQLLEDASPVVRLAAAKSVLQLAK